jgi:predicted site-specific integrase-resolvase
MDDTMHLTPRQLATRWQVSEKTLERWRCKGGGPIYLKLGGRILYPSAQVEAMEAQQVRKATGDTTTATETTDAQ